MSLLIGDKSGKTVHSPFFDSLECRQYYENLVIEKMKQLKIRLENVGQSTGTGPREIEL